MVITLSRRFRGPLTSANGGYACGRLASFVDAEDVEVTLRLPPPPGTQLQGRRGGGGAGREPLPAAPWTVRESAPEIVWAAIDCPGAYAVGAQGRGEVVLGRMTARALRVPEVGERCVVAAWPLGEGGRKLFAGTALFAA